MTLTSRPSIVPVVAHKGLPDSPKILKVAPARIGASGRQAERQVWGKAGRFLRLKLLNQGPRLLPDAKLHQVHGIFFGLRVHRPCCRVAVVGQKLWRCFVGTQLRALTDLKRSPLVSQERPPAQWHRKNAQRCFLAVDGAGRMTPPKVTNNMGSKTCAPARVSPTPHLQRPSAFG